MEKNVPGHAVMTQPKPTPQEIIKRHFDESIAFTDDDINNLKLVVRLRLGQTQRPILPHEFFELARESIAAIESIFQRNFEAAVKEVHRIHPPAANQANGGGLALPPGAGTLLVPPGAKS